MPIDARLLADLPNAYMRGYQGAQNLYLNDLRMQEFQRKRQAEDATRTAIASGDTDSANMGRRIVQEGGDLNTGLSLMKMGREEQAAKQKAFYEVFDRRYKPFDPLLKNAIESGDTQQVKNVLSAMGQDPVLGKVVGMVDLGSVNITNTKWGRGMQAMMNGKPVLVYADANSGKTKIIEVPTGVTGGEGQSLSVETLEGTTVNFSGGGAWKAPGAPMINSKQTNTQLEKDTLAAADSYAMFKQSKANFMPEASTNWGVLKNAYLTLKEKSGLPLNDQQKQYVQKFNTSVASSRQAVINHLYSVAGKQLSDKEFSKNIEGLPFQSQSLMANFLQETDSPTQFQTKLNLAVSNAGKKIARSLYAKQLGAGMAAGATDDMLAEFFIEHLKKGGYTPQAAREIMLDTFAPNR